MLVFSRDGPYCFNFINETHSSYFIRDWIDWNKKFIYRVAPGPCKQVLTEGGSEDITYIGNDIVIISSGIGEGEGEGVIKALDLNTSQVVNMTIRGAPDRKEFHDKATRNIYLERRQRKTIGSFVKEEHCR